MKAMTECPICDGRGFETKTICVAGCCGRPTKTGECCGNAVPIPEETEEQCCGCGGSGWVPISSPAPGGTER